MQGDKRVKKPVIALKIRLQSITLDFTRPASNKRAVIYELKGTSLEEQVRRIKDIEAIESDSFVPQAFKSSRDDIKLEPVEVKQETETVPCHDISIPTSIVYNDSDTLAHPNLFMAKEKAEELWLNRLIALRQERLMGSPVT
ncbi:unnamed protein product [Menidia menidia]|uniref:(Atlantic silverside) hypothetical protein n=1 Tax=Menidia menidia TaxID=238744 RepID=A0A8S4BKZ2_9TELE|nr:unnamed protein product [Menidia menidia]